MKKIIYILTTIAISSTLVMGCASNSTSTTNNETSQSTSNDNGSDKHGNFQKADLEGEVTSINGNKITLKLIKTPDRSKDGGGKPSNNNGQNTNSDSNQSASSNSTNKDTKGTPPQRQIEYTGETKDLTIGDDVKITTMSRGQQNSESKTLSTSDIKVGNILQITYSDKSSETISNINVMPDHNGNNSSNAGSNTTSK